MQKTQDKPLIRVERLEKVYRRGGDRQVVLRDIGFDVQRGEMLAVVGSSGSGKTTLLNIIGGLDRDYTGNVEVCGINLATLKDKPLSRFRNKTIGFVFQQFNVLEHLNCVENVVLPAVFGDIPWNDAVVRAEQMLERVGLAIKTRSLAHTLSGGQKQRLAIARALFSQPEILLCDEPTGNLDARIGKEIVDMFVQLNRDEEITLVVVTHEARVSETADRIVELEDGAIVRSRQGWLTHEGQADAGVEQ